MDFEYINDLAIIVAVLFSCGFTILYWWFWLTIRKCLKLCFQCERLCRVVKSCWRYVCQTPRRAYYAFYRRMGVSVFFAEVFPDETNPNFEDDTENQVIYDHDAEVLSGNNPDFNEVPIELVLQTPGVDNNYSPSIYSSHSDLGQTEVQLQYSPIHSSANSHDGKDDVLSADDESIIESRVVDWVDASADSLINLFDENTPTTPAQ
ncbi:hypothetical protein N7486_002979 [Penicillium sp. IBT 16267x]|nr:hypothetical protein N7486_002979 [Penicillium sp. IBT 16267x]